MAEMEEKEDRGGARRDDDEMPACLFIGSV